MGRNPRIARKKLLKGEVSSKFAKATVLRTLDFIILQQKKHQEITNRNPPRTALKKANYLEGQAPA